MTEPVLLTDGALELEGRLLTASNATFVGTLSLDGATAECVYKPVRGERPLWDFPDGTLANRERAAYLVSEATGWGLVPPTVLRDGPFGAGMVQLWIDAPEADDDAVALVDVVPLGDVPAGWLRVLDAEDDRRQAVSLIHRDSLVLQQLATLDAMINNADRKGGHVLCGDDGRVYGCDHGVTFHQEGKLRTVLWGWAGEPLPDACRDGVGLVAAALKADLGEALRPLLSPVEQDALTARVRRLTRTARFPMPSQEWPAIPWPAF